MSKVLIEKNNSTFRIKPWNRVYTIDETPSILSSVISGGKELLASPMTIYMESNGKEVSFKNGLTLKLNCDGIEGKENVIAKSFESDAVIINIEQSFFEDGLNKVGLTVMPKGKTVAQSFFGVEGELPVFKPNKLYLDVHLNPECAEYYQVYPINDIIKGKGISQEMEIACAGIIPKSGFQTVFKEQVYINGDDCGLGFIFRDDSKHEIDNKERVVEFIRSNGENILRFHFFDRIPKVWDVDYNEPYWKEKMTDMPPITFSFGIIATPVKEYIKDNFYERNLHIDCFKKIPQNYDDFLAGAVAEGNSENGYDRIARLGVRVLYIHEKWNDVQNSPFTTDETIERAKTIVKECHKRGIKVIPYFGYELSSLSPLFQEHGDEFWMKKDGYPYDWHWYRYPYQRDYSVCIGSKWSQYLYDGITKLYDEIGFDGLYFDGTVVPGGCKNTAHGCGYIDSEGNLKTTHPVWEIREFIKKMYSFVKSRGGTINVHGGGAFNMAAVYYMDSLWEGEMFQGLLLNGKLHEMPEGHLRSQFTGRNTGTPVYSLCYSNDPVWTFKSASAFSLLHGSVPKPVDIGAPLEQMSKIWDAFDKFPLKDAEWKPYWKENSKIKSDNDAVKISAWETDGEMLIVCASTNDKFNGTAVIDCEYKNIFDALDEYKQISENGILRINLTGIDYKMLYLKK